MLSGAPKAACTCAFVDHIISVDAVKYKTTGGLRF